MCDCLTKCNEGLKGYGTVDVGFLLIGHGLQVRPLIKVSWERGTKKRKVIYGNFCPWCGENQLLRDKKV